MRFVHYYEANAVLSVGTQDVNERRLRETLRRHKYNATLCRGYAFERVAFGAASQVLLTNVQSMPAASSLSV
jgi:hypothetical protein